MSRRFWLLACLVRWCAVIALGATTAAGAQAPSRSNPNTRSIQPGGAGESAATRSLK